MPSVITADPAVLSVTAPDGTPFVATTEDGPTLTGTVSSNTVTLTGALGQIIKTIMVGTGAYFDGSMPWDGSWSGTPDASTSLSTSFTGTPLVDDAASPVSYRFTGTIAGNSVRFPAFGKALTPINAVDRSARLASRTVTFRPAGEQETLSTSPFGYWPMTEPADSTTAGDVSKNNRKPMTPTGTGAAPVFGKDQADDTSPNTGVTLAAGQWLRADLPRNSTFDIIGFTFDASMADVIRTTVNAQQTIGVLADVYGPNWVTSVTAAGKAQAVWTNVFDWSGAPRPTITGAITITDGQPHDVRLTVTRVGTVITMRLYVDGTLEGSYTGSGDYLPASSVTTVGGGWTLPGFTGLISHHAVWARALTATEVTEGAAAHLNGFKGEQTQDRLARYARWAGIPDDQIVLDDDASYQGTMGAIDTDGVAPWDAMTMCETVEGGLLSIDGAGRIRFRARGTDYNQAATATIPPEMLRDSLEYTTDPANVVNDLTGDRPGGATQRVINQASIDEFGRIEDQVTIPADDDQQVADHLSWRLFKLSEPAPRADGVSVRLTQLDDDLTAALMLVEPGDRIDISTGLPSQAPSAEDSLVVTGWTETYSLTDGATWSADATPAPEPVWTIEDPLYGGLDDVAVIAY